MIFNSVSIFICVALLIRMDIRVKLGSLCPMSRLPLQRFLRFLKIYQFIRVRLIVFRWGWTVMEGLRAFLVDLVDYLLDLRILGETFLIHVGWKLLDQVICKVKDLIVHGFIVSSKFNVFLLFRVSCVHVEIFTKLLTSIHLSLWAGTFCLNVGLGI